MSKLIAFLHDENGATALEYSMISAIVSIVILGGVLAMGSTTQTRFSLMGSAFQ